MCGTPARSRMISTDAPTDARSVSSRRSVLVTAKYTRSFSGQGRPIGGILASIGSDAPASLRSLPQEVYFRTRKAMDFWTPLLRRKSPGFFETTSSREIMLLTALPLAVTLDSLTRDDLP